MNDLHGVVVDACRVDGILSWAYRMRCSVIQNFICNNCLYIRNLYWYWFIILIYSKHLYISKCFGSKVWTHSEKAIAANASAVREWDSNGTVFGYNPNIKGHDAGEFGHNDFYPVVIAACQNNSKFSGQDALKAMILLDEIRGRLCEVFSLKSYKIDHVVHGAIASAAVYGAMLGATPN